MNASPSPQYQSEGGDGCLECLPVRDWVADWNKWSRGERLLAVLVTVLLAALPFSLLISGRLAG